MKSRNLLAAPLAIAVLAIAGCGGASDDKDAAGASSEGDKATLSLVAYSTPQVVYDEIIPAYQQTPEGQGVGFKTSFGARATSRARSRRARRPTSSRSRPSRT